MSQQVYQKFIDGLFAGSFSDIVGSSIRAYLLHIGSGYYEVSIDTDTSILVLPTVAILSSCEVNGATYQSGRLDSEDLVFPLVTGSVTADAIVFAVMDSYNVYQLMAYHELPNGLLPTGSDINIEISADGILTAYN